MDIDLDYFLESNKKNYLIPKRENVIIKEIEAINRLLEFASITTIATSPNIGNSKKGHQQFIQGMFSKYFSGNIDISKQPEMINGLPLHVVCNYADPEMIYIVTVYIPSDVEWICNYQQRRKGGKK